MDLIKLCLYMIHVELIIRRDASIHGLDRGNSKKLERHLFLMFSVKLAVVVDFLKLQDKCNIHASSFLVKNQIYLYSCETAQRSFPKSRFPICFKLAEIIFIFSDKIIYSLWKTIFHFAKLTQLTQMIFLNVNSSP
jgi:hypothetical protein